LFKILAIIFKLIFLLSFVIAEDGSYRCGFTSADNKVRSARPTLGDYYDTEHFRIHYHSSGDDAPKQCNDNQEDFCDDTETEVYPDDDDNGYPDYIDELAIAAEFSYDVIFDDLEYKNVTTNQIMSDCVESNSNHCDDFGGNPLYDIYVKDLYVVSEGGPWNEYGSNQDDERNDVSVTTSYIFIDNGMTEKEYFTYGIDAMKTTIAHEFFHAVQRAYRNFSMNTNPEDLYFYEMSSAWVEDIVYPDINDYIQPGWTDDFFDFPDMLQNIYDTDGYSIALYAHYLTSKIGEGDNGIIQDIWEEFKINANPLVSIDDVLKIKDTNFIRTWVDFCSLNFFNGFYPDQDNEFYYHPDQAIAQPMTIPDNNHDHPNNSSNYTFISNISSAKEVDNTSIEMISSRGTNQEAVLNFEMNTNPINSNLIGNVILLSENNLDSQRIIDINDISDETYDGIEYTYFILGLNSQENEVINFDISFCNKLDGDVTSDCVVNILDYIQLVKIIMDNEPFSPLCNLNDDTQCDAVDAVLLINLILETP